MRQLKVLVLASAGCAIAIGSMNGVLAKEHSPMGSPTTQMSSPINQMTSPTAAPTAAPTGTPTAKLSASLAPTSEVPATAAKGSGSATVNVYSQGSKVCYRVNVTGLDTVTGAHIHRGMAKKNGPVVISLNKPGGKGLAVGCATAKPALIQDLASNPSHYYVNVHTQKYGNGAIRGQLAVASSTMMHP